MYVYIQIAMGIIFLEKEREKKRKIFPLSFPAAPIYIYIIIYMRQGLRPQ